MDEQLTGDLVLPVAGVDPDLGEVVLTSACALLHTRDDIGWGPVNQLVAELKHDESERHKQHKLTLKGPRV